MKTSRSQSRARRDAKRFVWHLQQKGFSHAHWWGSKPEKVSRIAAFWEVLRRHPKAAGTIQKRTNPRNAFEGCLYYHGLNSWQELSQSVRDGWRDALAQRPPQRGFDPRSVFSVTTQSLETLPETLLTLDKKLRKRASKEGEAARLLENAERTREVEIARLAIEHHQAGRILIAIHPDVANFEDAVEVLKACYKQHHKKAGHGRERIANWLDVIESFERSELNRTRKTKASDQLAARYRRVLAGFQF